MEQIALLVRLETAMFAIREALNVVTTTGHEDSLHRIREELGEIIGELRGELGLPP